MRVLVTVCCGGVPVAGGVSVLSLHDALPIWGDGDADGAGGGRGGGGRAAVGGGGGGGEHVCIQVAGADRIQPAELDRGQRVAAVIVERAGGERGAGGHAGDGDGNDRVGIDLRQ